MLPPTREVAADIPGREPAERLHMETEAERRPHPGAEVLRQEAAPEERHLAGRQEVPPAERHQGGQQEPREEAAPAERPEEILPEQEGHHRILPPDRDAQERKNKKGESA